LKKAHCPLNDSNPAPTFFIERAESALIKVVEGQEDRAAAALWMVRKALPSPTWLMPKDEAELGCA